ncbi:MAG TPA: DNA gyrase subunit A [Kiritimatiellia bacterium]|nr:DNA gyrase subunit A [Kiritimatiellia bacterium]HNS80598.1 DNA gyrase subunit A [Kiritimatiellia bacterium]HPA79008.1 DNA gyrase subunit A [Kiritimatiellia bacterium]HQQ05067.1 DNA gyrase subunit A [Kiritimatiellia bacterium]
MLENNQNHLINIEDEMQRAYIDYSMSVIIGRALPDARDGLKPGNRRILFAMKERGWIHSKPFVKCAKVVGEVIGNYHPHGDSAVYDTLVRMAQDFSMRCILIDGQGNFGSIDGDRAAAYRYTECRLKAEAEEMLADIEKSTVEMRPNFDESLMEPAVLPSRIPNLLVNGSTGIAVGMATNIPPHNLAEIADGMILLIDNPDIPVAEICKVVKGPDFPTGGVICGLNSIREMYETGRGKLKVRGRAGIETANNGRESIIITEIPYTVNKASLIEKMAHLVNEKTIEGISDIRDESGKEGIRVVVEIKRGAVPKVVLNSIFKHTQMETTFGAIMLAIDHGKPRVMNLKDLMTCFIDHRVDVITKRTEFDLAKAEARAHILEGLKIAIDHMDAVVKTIREAKDRDDARVKLMARFGLSELQANAILEMRLYQLTGLERDKVENEYLEIIKLISYLRDLLASPAKILGVVKEELLEIKERYGDKRRTDIVADAGEINIEDLIADERCVITVSHTGYIKRVPTSSYRQQKRGGKGVVGMDTKEEDYVEHVFMATTHDYLLCFTQAGRMHWIKVYDIPEGSRTARGKAIVNLLQVGTDEKLASMLRVREFSDTEHLVMATRKGIVKKTNLSAYSNVRAGGIIAISIDPDDELIGVVKTVAGQDLILTTRNGMSIRFDEGELRDQGRATRGVKGMTLSKDDIVENIAVVDPSATFISITENGYGKRTNFDEYRRQSRGGKGIITIRTTERNGKLVAALSVKDQDALMLISQGGQMIRFGVSDLRVISRNTQGVRVINLDEGDRLISATPLEPEVEDEEEDKETAGTPVSETPPAGDQ